MARNRVFLVGIAVIIAGTILELLSAFTSPFDEFEGTYAPAIWNWLGILSGIVLFFAGIILLDSGRGK